MNPNMRVEKPELVQALAVVLADNVNMYFKAHGHHWNVMGSDFSQFHDFFGEIYTDVLAQFDPIAENMRKMGANAPYQMQEFINLSQIEDCDCANSAMLMVEDLYKANNIVIQNINVAFKIANDLDEQGIADYLASRDDQHKKLRWQLQAFMMPESSQAPAAEKLMNDANGCPLCTAGADCVCPACEGGECLCLDDCACPFCHVQMMNDPMFSLKEEQAQALQAAGIIVAEEQDLAKALLEIAEKHGKFNEDRTGIWAGYTPAAENEYKEIGVKCINCVLYEGPGVCKIIAQPVEDEGKCRFAVIPDGVVKVEDDQIVAAGNSPCWDGYKQVGMKKGKNGNMVPNCVPVDASNADVLSADEDECPAATQDIELNLKNRQNAIDNVGYGPLNPKEPNEEFWQEKADKWKTTPEEAKTSLCGNCVFFVRTPQMLDCISSGIQQGDSSATDADAAIDQAELGYCEALDFKCAASRTCNAWAVGGPITAASSKPAPKKDRIYGSKKNPKGSAAGGKKIVFSDKVESALRNKVEEHNKNAKPGRKATLPMLKAVYRRGSGAFSSSHRPGKTRDQWAMARVNAFLKLLKSGSPANPNYKQDNDLLPKGHPKSSRAEASLLNHEILQVALKSAEEYGSPEHAIFSMAEYSGLGYDAIPALRGAWLRGVRDGDIPFQRAYELATKLYDSRDADLLPKKTRKVTGE